MAPTNKVWSSGVARFSFPNSPAVPSGQKRQCFLFLRCIIYFLSTLWAPAICLITAERLSWQRQGLLARPWPKRTVRVGSPVLHENPGFGKAQGAQWGVEVPALGGGGDSPTSSLIHLLRAFLSGALYQNSSHMNTHTLVWRFKHEFPLNCTEHAWIPSTMSTHIQMLYIFTCVIYLPHSAWQGGLGFFSKTRLLKCCFFSAVSFTDCLVTLAWAIQPCLDLTHQAGFAAKLLGCVFSHLLARAVLNIREPNA